MGYMPGRGHMHYGPGTSMVQFTDPVFRYGGMGACCSDCAKKGTGTCCKGMGLFDSGFDLTQWGWPEWGVTFLALWGLSSFFSTSKRAYSGVRGAVRKRRGKAKKRQRLQEELSAI